MVGLEGKCPPSLYASIGDIVVYLELKDFQTGSYIGIKVSDAICNCLILCQLQNSSSLWMGPFLSSI